ncbi:hypothetical protein VTJ49DRAFT_5267 [Mycothermus thermophilus]|uniref:P-type Ca(2+) transporter n=1 Tax=Humicola insolens TaxID=85995 RepID=A0ABR3VKT6_HUMIN
MADPPSSPITITTTTSPQPQHPFTLTPAQLSHLTDPKSISTLRQLGGLQGLATGLQTNLKLGLPTTHDAPDDDDATPRRSAFGTNTLPARPSKSFLALAWLALQDRVLVLLSVAAAISLALGLYQTFDGREEPGPHEGEGASGVEWIEGVAIIVAIAVVVLVGALNDWQKERQFRRLSEKREDREVTVVRGGKAARVGVKEVMVGDVVVLEQGDVLPVDGVLIEGHNVSCDEASATGESDLVRKLPAEEAVHRYEEVVGEEEGNERERRLGKIDPFLLSGARVLDGVGTFLVTAVGQHSMMGRTMMALREDPGMTPLQARLSVLAGYIAKLGSAAGLLLFTVLLIEFLARLPGSTASADEKGQNFLRILMTAITIVVVAVPEGLPLAVTLSLAFATKKMTRENNLVRHLQSCETMGNATVICSDKTGTLTQNVMTVVGGSLGTGSVTFGEGPLEKWDSRDKNNSAKKDVEHQEQQQTQHHQHLPTRRLASVLPADLTTLLRESVAINTTAFEGGADDDSNNSGNGTGPIYIGTKTETSLLDWARRSLGLGPLATERERHPLVAAIPFSSRRKCMGSIIELAPAPDSVSSSSQPRYRLLVKGAPEVILAQCRSVVGLPATDSQGQAEGEVQNDQGRSCASSQLQLQIQPLGDTDRATIEATTSRYAALSLRTLALAYRDLDSWPPRSPRRRRGRGGEDESNPVSSAAEDSDSDDEPLFEHEEDLLAHLALQDLTFLCIVAIQDPVRPGVPTAVSDCHRASVSVKMVTGDKVETARAIAKECGILTPYDEETQTVMEGSTFRSLTGPAQLAAARSLRVLARSSPEDKRVLVSVLKSSGEVVAVTGDGTNDAAALRAADVGFSMGLAGTEVAKEASDIILMDDNFASIVKALAWGRAINDAVKKFLQFQVTVNITAVVLTFISAVASDEERSVLSAIQLLWVNLIMDTFAALALATDPPTGTLLDRAPEPRLAPLITLTMWKMILGQSLYQLAVCLTLHFAGPAGKLGFLYPTTQQRTLVFNTFVFMQIFKLINSRRIDNKLNIFEGLHRNHLFHLMMTIMILGQVLIIFFGGAAFGVVRLTPAQWGISLVLGFLSIPVGILIRLVPDAWLAALTRHLPRFHLRLRFWKTPRHHRKPPTDLESHPTSTPPSPSASEDSDYFGAAMWQVRDDLAFLKRLRGGRLEALGEVMMTRSSPSRSRRGRHDDDDDDDDRPQRARQTTIRRRRGRRDRRKSLTQSAVGMPGLLAASIAAMPDVSRETSAGTERER